jgi:hypothetical protein
MGSPLLSHAIPLGFALFMVLFWFMKIGSTINKSKKRKMVNAAGWYFVVTLLAFFYFRNDMLKEKWIPQGIMSYGIYAINLAFFPPLALSAILAVRFQLGKDL